MRVLLFTGKGGVGKTTLAAATAARLAWQGEKTLVVSTDPAHSLADAMGEPLSGEPSEVDICLHAAQIDSRALVDRMWRDLRQQLSSALVGAGVDSLDAEELTVLPGVDDLVALGEVYRLAQSGPWDTVVVDCGPTAETLRLLSLPEAVSAYLGRMFALPAKVGLFKARAATTRAVNRLVDHVDSLRGYLTDPKITSVRLVLTPERMVVAETRRTLSSLALRNIRVDGMIVNRMMPAPGIWRGPAAAWMRTRRNQQNEVLTDLSSTGLTDIARVEHQAREPLGLPALRELAEELYGERSPLASMNSTGESTTPLLQVSKVADRYQLRIALPLERAATVNLTRVDDDLAVTVEGFRRLIALPELLKPCRVGEAESDSGGVTVTFERVASPQDPRPEASDSQRRR